jgi:hypothetical protein
VRSDPLGILPIPLDNQEVLGPLYSHFQVPMLFKEMDQAWLCDMILILGMNLALKRENGLWGSKQEPLVTMV